MRSKSFPVGVDVFARKFFIHRFLSFVLLLLLHNSGKRWISTLQSGEPKSKVVENTSQRPDITYVHSGIFSGNSKYRL